MAVRRVKMSKKILLPLLAIALLLVSPVRTAAQTVSDADLQPSVFLRSSMLTLSAAAFRPTYPGYNYENDGRYLKVFGSTHLADAIFIASVNLPAGSMVRRMTLHFRDNKFAQPFSVQLGYISGESGSVHNIDTMTINTPGSSPADPYFYSYSSSPLNAQILTGEAYFVKVSFPFSSTDDQTMNWICGVTLDYDLPDRLQPVDNFALIPAVATPYQPGYDFYAISGSLTHLSNNGAQTNGWYMGMLNLPQGATITGLKFVCSSNSTSVATARIQVSNLASGDYSNLAAVSSNPSIGGNQTLNEGNINAIVDNTSKSYWVSLDLPPDYGSNNNFTAEALFVTYQRPADTTTWSTFVPASAFSPFHDSYNFQDHGRFLRHVLTPAADYEKPDGWFLAPVDVPHGAVITNFTLYAYTKVTGFGRATLQKSEIGKGDYSDLVSTATYSWASGFEWSANPLNHLVDMQKYAYWIIADVPPTNTVNYYGAPTDNDFAFQGARVDYTYAFPTLYRVYIPQTSKP
jgi:hypothetical protein